MVSWAGLVPTGAKERWVTLLSGCIHMLYVTHKFVCLYGLWCMCVCVYERERARARERESERDCVMSMHMSLSVSPWCELVS